MICNELCRPRNDENPPDRNRGEQLKTQARDKAGGSNSKGLGSVYPTAILIRFFSV